MTDNGRSKGAEIAPNISINETEANAVTPEVDHTSLANGALNTIEKDLTLRNVEPGSTEETKIPVLHLPSNKFISNTISEDPKKSKDKMEGFPRLDLELKVIQSRNSNQVTKRTGWERIMLDMRNKNLLPIKTLFFFKAATLFVLYPFLTLHIKSLGLDAAEAGINSAFIPVVAILGPPTAGIIADRIGNFKVLLAAMTFVTAGLALLLLLVPVARETVVLPPDIIFGLSCGNPAIQQNQTSSQILLETVEKSLCTLNLTSAPWRNLRSSEIQCGKLCPIKQSKSKSLSPMTSFPLLESTTYLMPGKKLTFTPSSDLVPSLVCSKGGNVSCYFAFAPSPSPDLYTTVTTEFTELKFLGKDSDKTNVTSVKLAIQGSLKFGTQKFGKVPACIRTPNDISKDKQYSQCVDKCLVKYKRKLFCSNTKDTIVYDVSLTFWLYTLFRIILGLGSATSWIMFEGAVLAVLKECGGDYGLQRVSALLAAIVVCPLSGALIYRFQDFRPAFCLYAILQCLSAFLTLKIDLTFKKPAGKVLRHLKEVLSQVEILIFFAAMFLSGSAWGYLESFLFWFLKNMGGSEILMGLTISVGGVAGLPLLLFSRVIIKKIGHVSVLCLGLLFYSIRLFGYSFIQNPWMCLPFEAMEAITASLAITAAATYAAALSTEQTITSIQGFMGALYFGIGRGAGSLLGGFLIKWYGERATFQIFAVAAFVSSVMYSILNVVYIRKHTRVKHGLDLNNLRGDKFELPAAVNETNNAPQLGVAANAVEISLPIPSSKSEKPVESVAMTSMVDAVVLPSDPFVESGGFVGPLDVNAFTDVPLDEESIAECRNPVRRRPASLPEKLKVPTDDLPHRPAEH